MYNNLYYFTCKFPFIHYQKLFINCTNFVFSWYFLCRWFFYFLFRTAITTFFSCWILCDSKHFSKFNFVWKPWAPEIFMGYLCNSWAWNKVLLTLFLPRFSLAVLLTDGHSILQGWFGEYNIGSTNNFLIGIFFLTYCLLDRPVVVRRNSILGVEGLTP